MHLFHPYPLSPHTAGPNQSDDVEMLQTDVMRFFAILCLCLMAIFALVKALPMSPPVDSPTIAEPKDLKADAQSLQLQIAVLKKKLAESRTQAQSASLAARQASVQARTAAEDEKKVISRLESRQKELEAVNQTLNRTRQKLKLSEMKLTDIVKDIDQKQQVQSTLKSQINQETENLKKIQTALNHANETMDKKQEETLMTAETASEPVPPEASDRQGYTLRFASDNALQILISGKKVRFYAVAGKNSWQLVLVGGRPDYIPSTIPFQIYEMETATIPPEYLAAFRQQVAAFGRSSVTWGVTLPAHTSASINRIIQNKKGGDLVIMPDGEVILN